jgi:hypothetical protein
VVCVDTADKAKSVTPVRRPPCPRQHKPPSIFSFLWPITLIICKLSNGMDVWDGSFNFPRLAHYYNPCTCNGEYVRTGGHERQHCSYTSHIGVINTNIIALASYTYHIHNHNHIISVGIKTPNLNTRTDSPPLD